VVKAVCVLINVRFQLCVAVLRICERQSSDTISFGDAKYAVCDT